MATIAPERTGTIVELDDTDDNMYADWFCLRTNPFRCLNCGEVEFIHIDRPQGTIVVWPENDDPALLELAEYAFRKDFNPRIIPYERNFGPCIPYEQCQ